MPHLHRSASTLTCLTVTMLWIGATGWVSLATAQTQPPTDPYGKPTGDSSDKNKSSEPEATGGKAPKQDDSDSDNKGTKEAGPGKSAPDKDAQGATTAKNSDKEASKKVMLEEAKYRKRLAKIKRLRELAQEQGNEERLAALDKLEAKITELHDRKIADARAKLGEEKFRDVDDRLKKGRGHKPPHGKGNLHDKKDDPSGARDDGKPAGTLGGPSGGGRADEAGDEPGKGDKPHGKGSGDDADDDKSGRDKDKPGKSGGKGGNP